MPTITAFSTEAFSFNIVATIVNTFSRYNSIFNFVYIACYVVVYYLKVSAFALRTLFVGHCFSVCLIHQAGGAGRCVSDSAADILPQLSEILLWFLLIVSDEIAA